MKLAFVVILKYIANIAIVRKYVSKQVIENQNENSKIFFLSKCTATAERMALNRAPPMIKLTQVSNTQGE